MDSEEEKVKETQEAQMETKRLIPPEDLLMPLSRHNEKGLAPCDGLSLFAYLCFKEPSFTFLSLALRTQDVLCTNG